MSNKRTILVVVEPENDPEIVVRRATSIAQLFKCDIKLLLCDPTSNPIGISIIPSDKSSELERAIEQVQTGFVNELAAIVDNAGISVETEIVDERPVAEAVISRAELVNPRFIMKGTHYHNDAERGIMVDTDWQLARICPFPIWFVKAPKFENNPHIVAAVDPTHSHDKPALLDDLIVQTAQSVAGVTNGEVHLFHSYEPLVGVGKEAMKVFKPVKLEIDKIDKKLKEEHRAALDALAKKNKIGNEQVHQLPGNTRDLLPTFARTHKTQLVVMGALARWGFKRMIIGSTAERVMDHLPCDILVVRMSG